MKKKGIVVIGIFASVLLFAGIATAQSLAGPWRYLPNNGPQKMQAVDFDDSRWPTMELPSNWFLMGNKEYPKKAVATGVDVVEQNNAVLGELDPESGLDFGGTVWYRRHVTVHPRPGTYTLLEVDMADYYTTVYVNGHEVGSHEGYFQKWAVDVSRRLRDGDNVIALKVSAPLGIYDMAERFPVGWPKHQDQIKGIFAYHDTRPGATSIRGQERSTGGIIRGISLRETRGVDIARVNVTPVKVSEDSAQLKVEVTLQNWGSRPNAVMLSGVIDGANFASTEKVKVGLRATATPGESVATTLVTIDKPQLWWTWDLGKQNLYQITLQAANIAGVSQRFGIRSITKDADWVFRLNGKRLYHRGSNYISTQWLSQADKAWSDRDVRLMVEANLNAIRVHAHLERPEFYEAADEQGVMVFQDFPLQWGYTDAPTFHSEALKQAADMVHRYGNHPSIILWCMHNESPHAMDWMKKRDPKQNLKLDDQLVALVAKLDPSRIAHRDSGTGDGHPYPGWYEGAVGDFGRRKFKEPFVTEYGAQSIPDVETLQKMFPKESVHPRTESQMEAWKFADFQPMQAFKFAGLNKDDSMEQMVRKSQRYQAQLLRFATEIFRRQKWSGSTGVYQFMFVDDWPSVTWSVLDYYRKPKEGYNALKNSMQLVLPSVSYQIDDPRQPVSLFVVNDRHSAIPGATVSWTIGTKIQHKMLDIPADAVIKVEDLGPITGVSLGNEVLKISIRDSKMNVVGTNELSAADFILTPAPKP